MNQEELKSLVDYDPETGIFTYKARPSERPCWNSRWAGKEAGTHHRQTGYIYVNLHGKKNLAHRLAFLYMTGRLPEQTDHINGIRHDNRWCNLREVNNQQNARNKGMMRRNTSGFTGVYWCKNRKLWYVRIRDSNSKSLHCGYFKSREQAIKRRKEMNVKLGYHVLHGTKKGL